MPSTATITSSDLTSFSAGNRIKSAEVNANFNIWRGHVIPVSPSSSAPATTQTYDLGNPSYRWRDIYGSPMVKVTSPTTTYTALTTDDVLSSSDSGGSYTITLYTAVGNVGRRLLIIKDSNTSNTITVDGNGAETIGGKTSIALRYYHDWILIQSDGSGWQIVGFGFPNSVISSSLSTTAWPITVNQYGDLTSFTLAPGTWKVEFTAETLISGGAGGVSETQIGVGTTTGNSSAGLTIPINTTAVNPHTTTNGQSHQYCLSGYELSPTTATTYYLKGYAGASLSNLKVRYNLTARRILP